MNPSHARIAGASCSLITSITLFIAGCAPSKTPTPVAPDRAPRPLSPITRQAQATYAAQEGNNRRGPLFSDLVTAVDMEMSSSGPWTRGEVLNVLGPPDLVKEDDDQAVYAYFYNRSAKKDWVAYINFRTTEVLIGRNEAALNRKFQETMKPYTGQ